MAGGCTPRSFSASKPLLENSWLHRPLDLYVNSGYQVCLFVALFLINRLFTSKRGHFMMVSSVTEDHVVKTGETNMGILLSNTLMTLS